MMSAIGTTKQAATTATTSLPSPPTLRDLLGGDAHDWAVAKPERTIATVSGLDLAEVPAAHAGRRIPERYATIEPDGEHACIVSTRGAWSRSFLVWMALLDEPFEVLGPAELAEAARTVVARLGAATG